MRLPIRARMALWYAALLAAVLVALVKLGKLMTVTPGPGALAFTAMAVLSLVASATFDPRCLWQDQRAEAA